MSKNITINGASNPPVKTLNAIRKIHSESRLFRAFIWACFMQSTEEWTGFNPLLNVSQFIFQKMSIENSLASSIIVPAINVVLTTYVFYIVKRIGIRRLLLIGTAVLLIGTSVSLIFLSLIFKFMHSTGSEYSFNMQFGPEDRAFYANISFNYCKGEPNFLT